MSSIAIAALITASLLGQQDGPSVARSGADPRCGSQCLFVALRALDLGPASLEELERDMGPPSAAGYSMLQLDQTARQFGAETIAVETTLDNLLAREEGFACIALVRPEHYVLLYDVNRESALLIDGNTAQRMPRDSFQGIWTRKALLIGRGPFAAEESIRTGSWLVHWSRQLAIAGGVIAALLIIRALVRSRSKTTRLPCLLLIVLWSLLQGCTPEHEGAVVDNRRGPRIHVDSAVHQLGDIVRTSTDGTREVPTTIRNVGDQDLEIRTIRRSCTCTNTAIDRTVIPPGREAILEATIELGVLPTKRASQLTVVSNDAQNPEVDILIEWRTLHSLRAEPDSFESSALRPGQVVEKRFLLECNGLGICENCRVEVKSSSKALSATFERAQVAERIPAGPRAHTPPANGLRSNLGEIRLRLATGEEAGTFRADTTIALVCGADERSLITLPGSWAVVQTIEVVPARLFLGPRNAGGRSRTRILVKSNNGQPFRVQSVSCEDLNFLVSTLAGTPESSTMHPIQIDFRVPEQDGLYRTQLIITTDSTDAERLVVPVSALVKGPIAQREPSGVE